MSLTKHTSMLLEPNVNSISSLRRETINAVARRKQLDDRVANAGEIAAELEEEALVALEHGNKVLARQILDERVDALKARASLREELKRATALARKLKTDLVRCEEQAGSPSRTMDAASSSSSGAECGTS
jgi:phage shock protein A